MRLIVNMSEKDCTTDINNMHKKFGKDRACGSGDILAVRQTDPHSHTDHNTSQPLCFIFRCGAYCVELDLTSCFPTYCSFCSRFKTFTLEVLFSITVFSLAYLNVGIRRSDGAS